MRVIKCLIEFIFIVLMMSSAAAQEKLKYGTAVKLAPEFYLPVLAAEEQGIFGRNGVNAEWFPFQSGADLHRAMAASAIKIASSQASADLLAIVRGVPAVIVAELQSHDDFAVWVASSGRVNKPEDLKGGKIGVSRLGGAEHAYGRLVANRLGIPSDVRFISTGGIQESLAVLVTGSIDAVVLPTSVMVDLMIEKRVRRLLQVRDFVPNAWAAYSILAHRDFVDKEITIAQNVVKSIIEANRYIMSPVNKPWVMTKMREQNGYSQEGAEIVYSTLDLSQTGKISKEAVKNVSSFMVEHGLMKASEVPPPEKVISDKVLVP
jgi:ABC-type nitrate/sulfonate/bicarbonate transport system substrate-binding protein